MPPPKPFAFLTLSAGLLGACAAGPNPTFDAEGIYIRHVRARLAPYHTQDFEAVIASCAQTALDDGLPAEYGWLCYREPPGRYWIILFSETEDGFAVPDAPDPLTAFARHLGGPDAEEALADLDYEIEWSSVYRYKAGWSTVEGISTATHPVARMIVRTIRPAAESAFDQALNARTAFFRDNGYPLPVEGFAAVSGAPGSALQVVFATDWPSFHSTDSFGAFARSLDGSGQAAYADRKQALMVTISRSEYYDGSIAPELSYIVEGAPGDRQLDPM